MKTEIKRILYATDLTENSAYAFGYAIDYAKTHDAKIVIFHVLEKMSNYTSDWLISYRNTSERIKMMLDEVAKRKVLIKDRLKAFCDKELKDNAENADRVESIEVCEGYPVVEILKKADELNCDAIVMGTHGKGIVKQAFLGSVAHKVLRRVKKPVLIIPLPEEAL
jgi:nucleotide-binding universal stress UspA family protein